MGVDTAIAWTEHTFNPWWGCERVSPGCQHCYAEAFAKRTGHAVWGKTADRRFFGDKHWAEPLRWNNLAHERGLPALVFCASMADVFEDRPELSESRWRLWALIEATPWLTWQLLTKRPDNVAGMVPIWWLEQPYPQPDHRFGWPNNVWIGTTVEDQAHADKRIPTLAQIPAPVRFLSVEPMLGPVSINRWVPWVDWVICGGESGPRHRPFDLDWARSLRDQCDAAGLPFFFKQVGGLRPTSGGHLLDGALIRGFPAERWADPA